MTVAGQMRPALTTTKSAAPEETEEEEGEGCGSWRRRAKTHGAPAASATRARARPSGTGGARVELGARVGIDTLAVGPDREAVGREPRLRVERVAHPGRRVSAEEAGEAVGERAEAVRWCPHGQACRAVTNATADAAVAAGPMAALDGGLWRGENFVSVLKELLASEREWKGGSAQQQHNHATMQQMQGNGEIARKLYAKVLAPWSSPELAPSVDVLAHAYGNLAQLERGARVQRDRSIVGVEHVDDDNRSVLQGDISGAARAPIVHLDGQRVLLHLLVVERRVEHEVRGG